MMLKKKHERHAPLVARAWQNLGQAEQSYFSPPFVVILHQVYRNARGYKTEYSGVPLKQLHVVCNIAL